MAQFLSDERLLKMIRRLGNDTLVTYTPSGGAGTPIYGIFDAAAETHDIINGQEVIGETPMIQHRTTDLTGTVLAGTILVNSTTYNITEVLPDGEGRTDLTLEEA